MSDETPDTVVESSKGLDGKWILQGVGEGYIDRRDGQEGSMAISENTGRVMLTSAGDQATFSNTVFSTDYSLLSFISWQKVSMEDFLD